MREHRRTWLQRFSAKAKEEPIAFVALVVSIVSLYLSGATKAQVWADEEIRRLIEAEAEAALEEDVDQAVSLYTDDALIRNYGSNLDPQKLSSWHGTAEIRKRYRLLPKFVRLKHIDVQVFDATVGIAGGGSARASSSTDGTVITVEHGEFNVKSLEGDLWEFRRVKAWPFLPWTGQWKISSFTYDIRK